MKLNSYMRLQGITEHELARKAGVSQPAINRLRNGRGNWTVGLLYRVSQATGGSVTLADLVANYVPETTKPLRRSIKKKPAKAVASKAPAKRGRPPKQKQPVKKTATKSRAKGRASARACA